MGAHTHQEGCSDHWGCPDPTLCFSQEAGLWVNLLSLAEPLELTLNVLAKAFPILTVFFDVVSALTFPHLWEGGNQRWDSSPWKHAGRGQVCQAERQRKSRCVGTALML